MKEKEGKTRILIIDSDEMMRIYFRDIFWIHGRSGDYEVLTASSLEEANKVIDDKDTCPNTIFLDVVISPQKGRASTAEMAKCAQFIKDIEKRKGPDSIKIILYCGPQTDDFKKTFTDIGVDGFLTKGESMPKEIIAFADQIHGRHNN